ncbi:ras-related protein Rab-17 isoform X3 [Homo sapiens]|uniref:ras-related protein Rab-17 isoform X3 n=1 Tax=Homo sapiens TaxID=9606 RepID=UPI0003EAEEDB|nr:ras-related protein Rab-17 isoform X3 [Homo sapiens]
MAQAHRTPQPRAAPSQPRVFKLVLLGSGSVGKSSLALRYVKNDFKSILPTVGCAFFTKVVDVGATSLKLEIWDTAGQEKYHSVCHLYFRGANAALLVYDITRKDSFLKAQQWLKDLEEELHPGEVLVMLVGNKTDLSQEREVTFQRWILWLFPSGREGVCRQPEVAVHGNFGQTEPPGVGGVQYSGPRATAEKRRGGPGSTGGCSCGSEQGAREAGQMLRPLGAATPGGCGEDTPCLGHGQL